MNRFELQALIIAAESAMQAASSPEEARYHQGMVDAYRTMQRADEAIRALSQHLAAQMLFGTDAEAVEVAV